MVDDCCRPVETIILDHARAANVYYRQDPARSDDSGRGLKNVDHCPVCIP